MDTPLEARPFARDSWIETARGRLFARVWPAEADHADPRAEAPIVLFHDSLGSVDLWRTFPERLCLRTGHTVIAYDRLGFGQSDPFKGDWTRHFIADEARTFFPLIRKQLGFDRFIAMGHSVGGAMAAHCAAAFPDACRALVTESAQAFVEERTLRGILDAKAAFQQEGQLDRLRKYHGDKARWVLAAWTDTWLSTEFRSWSLEDELAEVSCPALVLHGEYDEFGSTLHPMRIAAALKGETRLEILPALRHVPHRESEAAIVELIRAFLDRALR